MSKSKALSRDEKRGRLLQIFHETQDFYQLKDLEKLAKDKGLIQNQVKEILSLLVDDGLVDSDKIGSSLFYWSFPNKSLKVQQKKLEELRDTKQTLNNKLVTLEAALKSEQVRNLVNNESQMLRSTWFPFSFAHSPPNLRPTTSQETQNDSDKLKRDQLSNGIVSLKERERDLLDFIKQNEAMDPEKAVKLRSDANVGCAGLPIETWI